MTIQDGFGGTDTLIRIENIRSGSGDDQLFGDLGANQFRAGSGNDILDGRGGDDILKGEGGDDTLTGGAGNDTLTGGSGGDTFRYTSVSEAAVGGGETITDFEATNVEEHIELDGLLNGVLSFVGAHTNGFAGGGNTSARFNDTSKVLEIDTDGDGNADMEITLPNVLLSTRHFRSQ